MINIKPGQEGEREALELFRAVNGLYNMLNHRGVMIESLEAGLKEMRSLLTGIICPYSVEQLDLTVKKQDEQFPDWEHWYFRSGTGVTWHGNPKSPDHLLWRSISPESKEAREAIVRRLRGQSACRR